MLKRAPVHFTLNELVTRRTYTIIIRRNDDDANIRTPTYRSVLSDFNDDDDIGYIAIDATSGLGWKKAREILENSAVNYVVYFITHAHPVRISYIYVPLPDSRD